MDTPEGGRKLQPVKVEILDADGTAIPTTSRELRWSVGGIVERIKNGQSAVEAGAARMLDWLKKPETWQNSPAAAAQVEVKLLALLQGDEQFRVRQGIEEAKLEVERRKAGAVVAAVGLAKAEYLEAYVRGRCNPGAQLAFLDDWSTRFLGLQTGRGFGKTWIGARKACLLARRTMESGLAVALSYQFADQVMLPALHAAAAELSLEPETRTADCMLLLHALPDANSKHGCHCVYVRSADKGDRIVGLNVGWAWGDETARWPRFPHQPDRDAMLMTLACVRTAGGNGQLIFTTTPEGRGEFWREFEESPAVDHRLIRGSTRDNARHLDPDYIGSLERSYSAELVRQYVDGEAVDLSGFGAYVAFSDQNIGETTYDPALPVYIYFDFNIAPMLCGWGQPQGQPPDAPFHVLGEIEIKAGAQTYDMVDQVTAALDGHKGPLFIFGDASGKHGDTRSRLDDWQIIFKMLRKDFADVRAMVPSRNPAVTERVARVNALCRDGLGRVRLRVPERCKVHIRDLRSVRWKASNHGTTDLDKTDPILTHLCLARGTMVATSDGGRPIEDVVVGDQVWTRRGLRRVTVSAMTRRAAPLTRLVTRCGRILEGTGNHPVLVGGRWVPLAEVRPGDELCGMTEVVSGSCSTGSSSTGIRSRSGESIGSTLPLRPGIAAVASVVSMSRSGRRRMARFLAAIMSTIGTAIRSTTRSRIWSACQAASTSAGTCASWSRLASIGDGGMQLDEVQPSGMAAPRVGLGIASTQWQPLLRRTRAASGRLSVPAAESRSSLLAIVGSLGTSSVLVPVLRNIGLIPALTTNADPARSAAHPSPSTATPWCAPVVASVARSSGIADVFDLTVEGEHEFFAAGILVSNSDALGYMVHVAYPLGRLPETSAGATGLLVGHRADAPTSPQSVGGKPW